MINCSEENDTLYLCDRRLSNIHMEKIHMDEVLQIVEDYTKMLVTSGYGRGQAREAIVSGIRG